MSDKSQSWYIRGEANQPAGPYTAEQLIASWRAGRVDAITICWREGMPEWLPLAQVEPFASALPSVRPPIDPGTPPVPRRRISGVWIGWGIAGAVVAIGLIVAVVAYLWTHGGDADGVTGAPSGFSLSDFERTKTWAMEQHKRLHDMRERVRREGNRIRMGEVEEAGKDLDRKLQTFVGKDVSWRIAVGGVTQNCVFLQSQWYQEHKERGLEGLKHIAPECYLAMAYGAEPKAASFGDDFWETPLASILHHTMKLDFGQQLSQSQAAKLNRGDPFNLRAVIERIVVSNDCILIRLGPADRLKLGVEFPDGSEAAAGLQDTLKDLRLDLPELRGMKGQSEAATPRTTKQPVSPRGDGLRGPTGNPRIDFGIEGNDVPELRGTKGPASSRSSWPLPASRREKRGTVPLRVYPEPAPGEKKPGRTDGEQPGSESKREGDLTGTWQATAGAKFKIADDGNTATIELYSDGGSSQFDGKTDETRRDAGVQIAQGELPGGLRNRPANEGASGFGDGNDR